MDTQEVGVSKETVTFRTEAEKRGDQAIAELMERDRYPVTYLRCTIQRITEPQQQGKFPYHKKRYNSTKRGAIFLRIGKSIS